MRWGVGQILGAIAATVAVWPARAAAAELPIHAAVRGIDVLDAEISRGDGPPRPLRWADLATTLLPAGGWRLRFTVASGGPIDAVEIPVCNHRRRGWLDGRAVPALEGTNEPVVVPLGDPGGPPAWHEITLEVEASAYEKRIVCSDPPRAGTAAPTREGLALLPFTSPRAAKGGGRAVAYVPPGHDLAKPGPLLVGLHPWNGDHWTYAHYAELLAEARAQDVLLLMPNGLGNSLYVAEAEEEVLLALETFTGVAAVDPRAISLWGASMGGAGATTVGFHHPDRFAFIASYFGDSKYDLSTYVRNLIRDEAAAREVNALDVVDNVRHVPVRLIHGDADRVSHISQSEMLDQALRARGFAVRFDRVAGAGHEGPLVSRFLPEIVRTAKTARSPATPDRVSYRSFRAVDTGAYWVHFTRRPGSAEGWADVERREDGVHVLAARGLRSITLSRLRLGLNAGAPPLNVIVDDARARSAGLTVEWSD